MHWFTLVCLFALLMSCCDKQPETKWVDPGRFKLPDPNAPKKPLYSDHVKPIWAQGLGHRR